MNCRPILAALAAAFLTGCANSGQQAATVGAANPTTPSSFAIGAAATRDAGALSLPDPAAAPQPSDPGPEYDPDDPSLITDEFIVELIKSTNGFRAQPEMSKTGLWVVGYGHMRATKPDMAISEEEADRLLREDLRKIEDGIRGMLTRVTLQREFSAMVDLARDIGTAAFQRSAVLRNFNSGDKQKAADSFLLWDTTWVAGEWVKDPPLVARRQADRRHFLGLPPRPVQE